jgi:hypothetical protein
VGLEVATALARQDATPLIVVLVVADPERGKALEAEARQSLAASGIHRNVTWRMIPRKDPAMLAGAVRAEGTGLLILPVEDTPERVSREFLSLLDVPALIVR